MALMDLPQYMTNLYKHESTTNEGDTKKKQKLYSKTQTNSTTQKKEPTVHYTNVCHGSAAANSADLRHLQRLPASLKPLTCAV